MVAPPRGLILPVPMLRWILAAVHLLGFGIGLGAVWARARSITSHPLDQAALRRTLRRR
jgi:hypothetical protein